MSSKKKHKRSCPFASAKKAPKQMKGKCFDKESTEALVTSDKGLYFDQDKLLELERETEEENDVASIIASRLKLPVNPKEDLEESESQEFIESQESWQKLNGRTIVSGNSLQEYLEKSVSCRFCHVDATLLENVSAKSGLGSSWIVNCDNDQCPSRNTNSAFNTMPRGKGFELNQASVLVFRAIG